MMYRGKLNNKCSRDQGEGEEGFRICPRSTSDVEYRSVFYLLLVPGVTMSLSLRPPSAITYNGKGLSYEADLSGLWFAGLFERNTERSIMGG